MFLAFQAANPDLSFSLIAPEAIVSVAGVIVMMVDAFSRRGQRWVTGVLSIVALIAAGISTVWLWAAAPLQRAAFNGMIVLDELRLSFTLIFVIVSILTVLIASVWIDGEKLPAGEFHSLLLFATCGMMLMASAGDLVIVFLGLEILSIATYVLAGFRRTDVRSNESSLKYFILGSFASAFLLYGIALVYGATAVVSTGGSAHKAWLGALAVMAVLTMTVGNVVAIVQNNVKRMLAYSSIAHAGYALVGFIAAGAAATVEDRGAALSAVAFYLLTYAVMNMGAFAVVTLIARRGDQRTSVDDYNGIGLASPVLAFSLSLFLLSLLGMPLTAGFMGKIVVFGAALQQGYVWLVVIGVLNTAVSAYYYLRLIILIFCREPTCAW